MGDEYELAEMREELARDMYDKTDFSMDYCRMHIERDLTDGEVFAQWERITARA